MKLYVLVHEENGVLKPWRGNVIPKHNQSLRRNIRAFTSEKQAQACMKRNDAPDTVKIVALVPQNVHYREDAYNWSWDELENHLEIFDHIEVNFSDGGEHKMFSGDSGITCLRVRDISPTKGPGDKVTLHILTDDNWFGKGRHSILSDEYIEKIISNTVAELEFNSLTPMADAEEALKKAFGIGVPPVGEPFISSGKEQS